MSQMYLSAPLPFVGQKRMFARHFAEVVSQYPEGSVFVDLFGGSGLLSHIAKHVRPGSRVVYNDYDNYRLRLRNIERTNVLLDRIRPIASEFPRGTIIKGEARRQILTILENEEREAGFLDVITLSTSLLFSGKYARSLDELRRENMYSKVRKTDYDPCHDYHEGLEIESCDYRVLFERFKDVPGVVFLVDPPYLSTDVKTYHMCWRLADYLSVLSVLPGHDFIYFTSNKSSLLELCEWMGKNPTVGNPFERCIRREYNASLNYAAKYTDIMLYTDPTARHKAN